jgi:hypothetical protein
LDTKNEKNWQRDYANECSILQDIFPKFTKDFLMENLEKSESFDAIF